MSVGSDPKSETESYYEDTDDSVERKKFEYSVNDCNDSYQHIKSNKEMHSSFHSDIDRDATGKTKRSQMLLHRIQALLRSEHSPFKDKQKLPKAKIEQNHTKSIVQCSKFRNRIIKEDLEIKFGTHDQSQYYLITAQGSEDSFLDKSAFEMSSD